MNFDNLHFKPNPEGWEDAKKWATKINAPEGSLDENLWEYSLSVYSDSYEALSFINNEYKRITEKTDL